MKQFLLGFVAGLVFAGLFAGLLALAAIAMVGRGSQPPDIADGSALVLTLAGNIPEQAPVDIPIPLLGQQAPLTMVETWRMLKAAADDDRIEALVLMPQGLATGWAKMEELRADILRFKESGKPVIAYLRTPSAREYYVASAADQIYMGPEDWLDLKGLRAELTYLKGTLDKLGVELEFESIGLYKDAPDQFTQTGPSSTTLEVMNQTLDQFYGNLIEVIGEGRNLGANAVTMVVDQGPFVGQNARDVGLVDDLIFEDQMFERLKDRLVEEASFDSDDELERVDGVAYASSVLKETGSGPRIAVVTGDGEILPSGTDLGFTQVAITAGAMEQVLREVREDDRIDGVIVRIDSPGGDAVASDEILHQMQLLSEAKPVVISMSDYAASGGYMMAMTGDPILAYNNTQTGSIGVFFGKANLRGLYDKIGITKYLLKRGQWSDIDSDYQPLTAAARAKFRSELETYYRRFVEQVADSRGEPYAVIEPLAQGRVWLGSQALGNGLVDEIGGLDRALELLLAEAGIDAAEELTFVTYPRKRTLTDLLLNRDGAAAEARAALSARIATALTGDLATRLTGDLPLNALSKGGVMQLMPYRLVVQ